MTAPASGVYRGVPFEQYHGWDAASNSRLTQLRRSPAHLRAYLETPHRDTTATLIGRATHSAILEPDTFDARYVVAESCCAQTKDGAACRNPGTRNHVLGWLCGVHAKGKHDSEFITSRSILPADDYATCRAVSAAMYRHPGASSLLSAKDVETELSIVWRDETSGVLCKARADIYVPGIGLADVKTTDDASKRAFARTIYKYRLDLQGAFYLRGAAVHGLDAKHFALLAGEKPAPHAVGAYRLLDEVIMAAGFEIDQLLARYAHIQTLPPSEWSAYPDDIIDIGLPAYAPSQIAEDLGAHELENAA
jgi:hypothetical protein